MLSIYYKIVPQPFPDGVSNGFAVSTGNRYRWRFKRWVSTICARDLHTALNAANPSTNHSHCGKFSANQRAGTLWTLIVWPQGSFEIGLSKCKQVALVVRRNFDKMRNCLSYCTHTLPAFLMNLGIWAILEIFDKFDVVTDVLTLDRDLRSTKDHRLMVYGATHNNFGLWQNRTVDYLLEHIIKIISNPGSPDEAAKINTAIKTLTIKQHDRSDDFYKLISEGLLRRTLFQKLCQIAGPLADEVAVNSELLIMCINRELMTMQHLKELSNFSDRNEKVANYLIHNVNNLYRLSVFLFVIQNWARDTNLIELVEDIAFDVEVIQSKKLGDKLEEDKLKKLCLIY